LDDAVAQEFPRFLIGIKRLAILVQNEDSQGHGFQELEQAILIELEQVLGFFFFSHLPPDGQEGPEGEESGSDRSQDENRDGLMGGSIFGVPASCQKILFLDDGFIDLSVEVVIGSEIFGGPETGERFVPMSLKAKLDIEESPVYTVLENGHELGEIFTLTWIILGHFFSFLGSFLDQVQGSQ